MRRVNLVFALVLGLLVVSTSCVEFEEEFHQNKDRPSSEPRGGGVGFGGLVGNWHSGLFDFGSDDDDFFLGPQSRVSPKNPAGQTDKESGSVDSDDREPFDVDFVSGPIGGGSGESTDAAVSRPEFSGFPFFPFGNFGNFGSGFPFNFGGPAFKPWWKGDNVCVEREEDITDWESPGSFSGAFSVNFETCQDLPNKHVCTTVTNLRGKKRTVTVTRQCCHGYGRPKGEQFCEKIDWAPVLETAEKLGANEFIRSAKNNGLEEKLSENITLFVPLDGAFTDFSEQMFETNLVVLPLARSRRSTKDVSGITTKDLALGHMVKGLIELEEAENEQLLMTEFENSTIRVNIFPKAPNDRSSLGRFKYTANCVPVTSSKLASNGIVHTVESVLVPVTQTLMEMVQDRSDLVVFRTILEKTDLAEQLNNQDKTFTVFAPNDNAFSKLEPNIRRIVKEGSACTLNILKNHILDLTFCGAAVVDKAKTNTFNVLGDKLMFERQITEEENATETQDLSKKSEIVINKVARVTESDLMATNGVLHVIDTVLETDSATPVTSLMEHKNLTIFKRLIEASGLEETFDTMSNVTFFAPTDKAFEQTPWLMELEKDPESLKDNAELRKFLEYHIATDYIKTCNLTEDTIPTMNEGGLRVNLYSTHPIFSNVMNRATVNCARLVQFDVDSCGSVLHQVDRVLEKPDKTLLGLLESTEKYSKFLSLVREANLTGLIEDTETDYTLLVPSNEVFAEQDEWYKQLLADKDTLERTIKSHILPDVLCCTGFVPSEWPFIRTIQTINQKSLRIDRNRRPMIGNAGITKCDLMATNGVVHEINDVIIIKESRRQPLFF